jgi:PAS domain S-box-containing protein
MTGSKAAMRFLGLPLGANAAKSAWPGEQPERYRLMRDGRELRPEELPVQRAAATGQPVRDQQLTVAFADGVVREIVGDAVPLFDAQGEVRGAIGAFLDISERKRADDALRKANAQYDDLVRRISVGVYRGRIEADGTLSLDYVSPTLCELLDVAAEEALRDIGVVLRRCHPADIDDFYAFVRNSARQLKASFWEGRVIVRDETRWVRVEGQPEWMSHGASRWTGIVSDITERKRFEDTLRKFSRAIEQSPVSIIITDTKASIEYVNPRFEMVTGYRKEEVIGRNPNVLKSSETPSSVWTDLWQTITNGGEWRGEFRNRKKNGDVLWESAIITSLSDEHGVITNYVAVQEDITTRKRTEDELHLSRNQLRALAARVTSAREEESKQLAREIHDEFGQALTAIKLDVSWLASKLRTEEEAVRGKVQATLALIDSTIACLRNIASRLRPKMLDELGLVPAIEWQVEQFQKRTGLKCEMVCSTDVSRIGPEQATAVFRIVQEALTNIARHARATRADVSIYEECGDLIVEIRDNGVGIAPERVHDIKSLGLLGMRERALAVGGNVTVVGASGKGTIVGLQLPIAVQVTRP